jgi:Ca2+-binding EF-hand superfamily protein
MPIGDVDPAEYFLSDEVYDLRKLFSQFDASGDGTIDASELHPLFQMAGIMIKPYQIDAVVKEFDIDGSGEIDFEEFMVMMVKLQGRKPRPGLIDYKEFLTEPMIEKYEKQFRKADKDGAGSLCASEIEVLFNQFGIKLSTEQMHSLMGEVDHDHSGEIEFDEFCCMMAKLTGVRKRINPNEYMERVEIEKLRAAFDQIDVSGDGTINVKELDSLLRKMGITLDKPGVDRMLNKYDADHSGELEFQEFAAMMVDIKKLRRKRRINPAVTTALELRSQGFTANEVKSAGFTALDMYTAKYPVREMVGANFKPVQLRQAGYTAVEMRGGGVPVNDLKRCGYSTTELRNAGYSALALHMVNHEMQGKILEVPNFTERREEQWGCAPKLPDHYTPRVRYFSDDSIKISTAAAERKKTIVELSPAAYRQRQMRGVARTVGGFVVGTHPGKPMLTPHANTRARAVASTI